MNKNLLWLVPIFFLMTVEYRIDLGFFSFLIVEPFVFLAALYVIGSKLLRREPLEWRNPLFLLFAGLTAWAIIIRPFSPDWKHGLSDIRDWLVPTTFVFILINAVPRQLSIWLTAFVGVALVNSVIGILQHFLDGFRFFAHAGTVFKGNEFGLGFFDAPNMFGLYLAGAIPLVYAWLRTQGSRFGVVRYALLLIPFLALYYSYSRTSMLVMGGLIVFLVLERAVRSTSAFARLTLIGLVIGAFLIAVGLNVLPHDPLRTIWWRVALWEIAGITLQAHSSIWLFGNGIDRFIPLSFYPQPHNLFVFMLLEYGIVGLLFTFGVIVWLLSIGLQARREGHFRTHLALAPMWVAVLGGFAVSLTETIWLGLNGRLLFATLSTFFMLALWEVAPALVGLPRWRLPFLPLGNTELTREQHP